MTIGIGLLVDTLIVAIVHDPLDSPARWDGWFWWPLNTFRSLIRLNHTPIRTGRQHRADPPRSTRETAVRVCRAAMATSSSASRSGTHAESKPRLRQRTDGRLDRSRDPGLSTPLCGAPPSMATRPPHERRRCAGGCRQSRIYRRWSSKLPDHRCPRLLAARPDERRAPDTGSLTGDFEFPSNGAAPATDDNLISNDLVLRRRSGGAHDLRTATALDDLILRRGRRMISAILKQAAARGEISGGSRLVTRHRCNHRHGLMRVIQRTKPSTPSSCDRSSTRWCCPAVSCASLSL